MEPLKLGMIGLDTSHCESFVAKVNCEDNPHHVPGARVVKAFPGGSPGVAVSRDRVQGFTKTLKEKYGIVMCDSLDDVGKGMDGFILTSVDGRQHRDQFRTLARFGKPVFIDKPLSCSTADAAAIADLAKKNGIPIMSSSMVRFAPGAMYANEDRAAIYSCEAFGGVSFLDDYPLYYWYVVHPADLLFSFMGKGCREVRAVHDSTGVLLVGTWPGGRIGTVRGLTYDGNRPFGRVLFGKDGVNCGIGDLDKAGAIMTQHIISLIQTGKSPIDIEETVEIMAFLEAAETSKKTGGAPVPIRL